MKIGELAHLADTPADTIRYYEREGLLAAPARSNANYRHYAPEALQRLRLIRRCRQLDMTLDEVRELLALADAPQRSCASVDALFQRHLGHVQRRIVELRRLEAELKRLQARCRGAAEVQGCGIVRGLQDGSVATATAGGSLRPGL
jgi:Cd(II)/Pb(II)-responsive transcriptional regulator